LFAADDGGDGVATSSPSNAREPASISNSTHLNDHTSQADPRPGLRLFRAHIPGCAENQSQVPRIVVVGEFRRWTRRTTPPIATKSSRLRLAVGGEHHVWVSWIAVDDAFLVSAAIASAIWRAIARHPAPSSPPSRTIESNGAVDELGYEVGRGLAWLVDCSSP
jgi:hypothetical protein